jgi:hemoglobin/transferrin/lactoferrin receptor protein
MVVRRKAPVVAIRAVGSAVIGVWCLLAALVVAPFSADAETGPDDARRLQPITVTATRNPIDAFSFPGMVTALGRAEIETRQPSSPDDVLKMIPGVEFTGGPRRTGEVPRIRGFEGADVIVTIDGARQNFDSVHDGRFFLDPSLLKRVEVLRGPASSLYGSGGTGGLIAFQTLDAADLLAAGENAGTKVNGGYRSVNSERFSNFTAYSTPLEGVDAVASVTARGSGTIRLGDGNHLRDTDDDILAGLAKASVKIAGHHRIEASATAFRNDAREPNDGQQRFGQEVAANGLVQKDVRSASFSAAYHYDDPTNRYVDLDAVVYRTLFRVDELRLEDVSGGPAGELLRRDVGTLGMRMDNRSRFPVSEATRVTLTYGAEYWRDSQDGGDGGMRMGQPDTNASERHGVPDADARFAGIFAQAEIVLPDPFGDESGSLLVIPGARYDSYRISSSNRLGADNNRNELSPKIGVTWLPTERLMAFANYAHAFRAPTADEIYLTGSHFPLFRGPGELVGFNRFEPNPQLKPQATRTVEVGAGATFNDVFAKQDQLQIKATHFRVRGTDFIDRAIRQVFPVPRDCVPFVSDQVRVPAGPPSVFRTGCEGAAFSANVPNARLRGTEVDATYDGDGLRVAFGFSTIDGENEETGRKLGRLAPDQFTVDAALKLPRLDSVVGWRLQLADRFDKVNDPADARASYAVHDFYFSWRPLQPLAGFGVDLGIDNAFDKAYTRVDTAAVEPGRNFRISAGYSLAW